MSVVITYEVKNYIRLGDLSKKVDDIRIQALECQEDPKQNKYATPVATIGEQGLETGFLDLKAESLENAFKNAPHFIEVHYKKLQETVEKIKVEQKLYKAKPGDMEKINQLVIP